MASACGLSHSRAAALQAKREVACSLKVAPQAMQPEVVERASQVTLWEASDASEVVSASLASVASPTEGRVAAKARRTPAVGRASRAWSAEARQTSSVEESSAHQRARQLAQAAIWGRTSPAWSVPSVTADRTRGRLRRRAASSGRRVPASSSMHGGPAAAWRERSRTPAWRRLDECHVEVCRFHRSARRRHGAVRSSHSLSQEKADSQGRDFRCSHCLVRTPPVNPIAHPRLASFPSLDVARPRLSVCRAAAGSHQQLSARPRASPAADLQSTRGRAAEHHRGQLTADKLA
jgi:hypothetical protein